MKRIILSGIIILLFIITGLFLFLEPEKDLEEIKVAEVTHSIFYAPQYITKELGYFEEVGLDVEFILTPGADKVTTAVLSGDVEIGFCGSEASIYVYNNGEEDYIVNFAGLTKRDGSFIVGDTEDFKMIDLVGSHIIAGRKGGMPSMTLQYALNKNGIKINDVNFDTSIDFPSMPGAYISGKGDYVALFEPTALKMEKEGYGRVLFSVGEAAGEVPYTVYNAKKSFIEENEDLIEDFRSAINKGLKYVEENSSEEVAKHLINYFPDTSLTDLTKIVDRYKTIDAWYSDTVITEDQFSRVVEIMKNADMEVTDAPYEKLIINE